MSPAKKASKKKKERTLLERRPTEAGGGLLTLLPTYGYLTQTGVDTVPALLLAIVAALVPSLITYLRERTW